ncbi:MAG: hypothetical protein CMF54_04785, partial [Legionellales bacterium]|nr:hypothetical protein [Legionellales bacterium]
YKNWELIFWDNFSNDNSKKIFLSYEDKRFKYFKSEKFTNLTVARNLAMSKSNGDYIAFLDTDDSWDENKIQNQIDLLKNKDASLVFTNYIIVKKINKKKVAIKKKIPTTNFVNFFLKKYPVSLSTIVFNKKKFKNYNFNEKYHIIGDFDFVMNTALNHKIVGINKPLAEILHHENNETKKKYNLYILELLDWYKNCNKIFFSFQEFKNYKKLIYYQMAKYFIEKKRYKKLFIIMKRLSLYLNLKVIVFLIFKILN